MNRTFRIYFSGTTPREGFEPDFGASNRLNRARLFNWRGQEFRMNREGVVSHFREGSPRRPREVSISRDFSLHVVQHGRTETVNTDHTSGSPAENTVESTEATSFAAPIVPNASQPVEIDSTHEEPQNLDAGAAGTSALPATDSAAVESSGHGITDRRLGARRADDRQESEPSHVGDQAVEGVTSIERLVESLQGTAHGYIDETVSQSSVDPEALEFRVIRPGAPVRRLRLTGNRYTFGSAEGCSIRLNDPALRPMHAVLLRDSSRILVRAYSVPVQVNETRMTEATLHVGDVLRLGAYQFELLSVSKPSTGSVFDATPTETSENPSFPIADGLGSSHASTPRASIASLSADASGSEDVVWRERLRREIDQWRERQLECDRRESRIDDREADLRNRETELWSRAENLYRRESRLQSQETANFQLYDEFTQRQQELIQLRDDARSREESFHLRELEFRNQELEYRTQLEEATRQLHQSQQQAEAATQAVQRMREQFESLNEQIEDLSGQHSEIEGRELRQRAEHERLRAQLETARDDAINAQARSEARRQDAESRVDAMAAQIAELQSDHGEAATDHQQRLAESETRATQLAEQVDELQQAVSEASEEAAQLRSDYEDACESVRQLETLVSESNQRGDQDRESWAVEADELRSAVERLSGDLERANSELSDLRDANQDLTTKLTDVQLERDQARDDAASRPSADELQSLRTQLEEANEQLAQMKLDYDATLEKLHAAERDQSREETTNEHHLAEQAGLALAGAAALGRDDEKGDDSTEAELGRDSAEPESTSVESLNAVTSEGETSETDPVDLASEQSELESNLPIVDSDDDAWPTYSSLEPEVEQVERIESTNTQTEPWSDNDPEGSAHDNSSVADDPTSVTDSVWGEVGRADVADSDPGLDQPVGADSDEAAGDLSSDVEATHTNVSDESVWPEQTLTTDHSASPESAGLWNDPELDHDTGDSDAVASDEAMYGTGADGATAEDPAYVPGDVTLEDEMRVSDSDDEDEIIGGSLASMLIKDLEAESAPLDHGDAEGVADASDGGWDREYDEELEPTEWANDPEGYRVEGHETAGVPPLAIQEPMDESSQDLDEHHDHESTPVFAESNHVPSGYETEDPAYEDSDPHSIVSEHDESLHTTEVQSESSDGVAASEVDYEPEPDFAPDDDSIEAYMNRLLRRVQGEPVAEAPVDEFDGESTDPVDGEDSITEWNESENSVSTGTEDQVDPEAPLVPLSQAPERGTDLDAMRELANASARIAITRSVRMQTRDTQIKGLFSFMCATGAILCGAACYYFLPGVIRYLAVAMTVVVSLIYIREGILQFREASQRLRAAVSGLSDEPAAAVDGENEEAAHENSPEEVENA